VNFHCDKRPIQHWAWRKKRGKTLIVYCRSLRRKEKKKMKSYHRIPWNIFAKGEKGKKKKGGKKRNKTRRPQENGFQLQRKGKKKEEGVEC